MFKFCVILWVLYLHSNNVNASPFDYPVESLVRVDLPQPYSSIWNQCTGIILNSAYILTHAACSSRYGSDRINVSIAFINTVVNENSSASKIGSVRLHVHNFHASSPDIYDMMLLELMDSYIQFDPYVHPAALYLGSTFRVFGGHIFEECAIMGWLPNSSYIQIGFYIHSLSTNNVSIVPNTECIGITPSLQNVICVRSDIGNCEYDLGSPLVCGSNLKWIFMGYYTGYKMCNSLKNIYVFRKLSLVEEWLNRTANGVYALNTDFLDRRAMLTQSAKNVTVLLWLLYLNVFVCGINLI